MPLIFVLLLLIVQEIKAQDLIFKKSNEILVVKILEISFDEIKYKEFINLKGATYSINKSDVAQIKFKNGKIQTFEKSFVNPYIKNRKNALKLDVLSPMLGKLVLGYEKSIKPGYSLEFQLGIIGAGSNDFIFSDERDANGFFVRTGYKSIALPRFYIDGIKTHLLNGAYVRPELVFGYCIEKLISPIYVNNYNLQTNGFLTVENEVLFGALMWNFGKQWVFYNLILLDCYWGIGIGFKTNNEEYFHQFRIINAFNEYSHAFMGPSYYDLPYAMGTGVKIGVLIK